jgi:glucosylceramidase
MPALNQPGEPIIPLAIPACSLLQWLTTADQKNLFQQQSPFLSFTDAKPKDLPELSVDSEQKYQHIEGFGFALTGGSAMLITRLPDFERQTLLKELFSPETNGIGLSFLRLTIGASDLSATCFSYNDIPKGQSDHALTHFNIAAGDSEVIPLLQEILQINPDIKIIASPWSAPEWMKTNQSFIGGKLKPDCYGVYADYLVKYVQVMRENGIVIHALTPQNEPLNAENQPSMLMEASEQTEFIKNHLGPALTAAELGTVEVFCWDHNCDVKAYPLAVLADTQARQYLSGSAWHLYAGDISTLSEVHQAYPEMKLYFTEQWVGANGQFAGDFIWHMKNVLLGSVRNWCQVVLEWNLAADPECRPHTLGGSDQCVGALTIGVEVSRNAAYYVIAHAAKFVRPGSVRIYSDDQTLPNAAFLTPAGFIVLIVLNDNAADCAFCIQYHGKYATANLPANAAATYIWRAA